MMQGMLDTFPCLVLHARLHVQHGIQRVYKDSQPNVKQSLQLTVTRLRPSIQTRNTGDFVCTCSSSWNSLYIIQNICRGFTKLQPILTIIIISLLTCVLQELVLTSFQNTVKQQVIAYAHSIHQETVRNIENEEKHEVVDWLQTPCL